MADLFIGIDALQEVATKVGTQIVMGPAYSNVELLQRMRIKVISGVQYKQVETLLVRKGGTTRRKVVGTTLSNQVGFLKERELEATLSWNRYKDNIDNYVETNYGTDAVGEYPISNAATEAILKNYAEDLTDNLFFGNVDSEDPSLNLYNGFHTYLAHDIAAGIINTANHNLIECEAIEAPTDSTDTTPYDIVMGVYAKLDPRLRKQKEILCYCDVLRGVYIADGYANRSGGHSKVHYNDDGTYTIPEMPRVTFVPEDAFGVGDRLIFTIPENFQYGVDNLNNQTHVDVDKNVAEDSREVVFQIQSIQGTRVLNPFSSTFAMTNGSISSNPFAGDFNGSKLYVNADATECVSIKVNDEVYTTPKDFDANAIIKIEATAATGYTFQQWSNGSTANPLSITATGMPIALTALFKKNQA